MRMKRLISRKEVQIILAKYHIEISNHNNKIGRYIINEDGSIDVDGNVIIRHANLKRIPFKFGRIYGDFTCSGLELMTLKGSPSYVSGSFVCKANNLTSLKHGPKYVGINYDCSVNKLQTLDGCATEVGRDLLCNNNCLINLEGSPEVIQGYFNCKNNKLKTLVGSPKELYGRFHVSHNLITNFEGSPQKISGEIYATSTFLNNLYGLAPDFDGKLFIDASAKSINTGLLDYKSMRIDLRFTNKYGYNFMPTQVMDNHRHIDLILKYQRHYEIWTELDNQDELDDDNFQILIEDIADGLL